MVKEIFNYRNYVIVTLSICAIIGFLGYIDEDNSFGLSTGEWAFKFFITKLIGFAFGVVAWKLFVKWDKEGKLPLFTSELPEDRV